MSRWNTFQFDGFVGQDATVKEFENKDKTVSLVTDFSVAHAMSDSEKPTWWNVRFRSQMSADPNSKSTAERAAEVKKGDRVLVEGKIWDYKSEKTGEMVKYIEGFRFEVLPHTKKEGGPRRVEDEIPI